MHRLRWCASACLRTSLLPCSNGGWSSPLPCRLGSHHTLSADFAKKRQGLIAVNYPARAFGIGRMCTAPEAKKMCPNIICQHVATWREGDSTW